MTYYQLQAVKRLKSKISSLSPKSCHFVVDIWSSRAKEAVIGIKTQFIDDDWSLMNYVVGFKHFPDHHTAANVRKKFNSI